MEQTREAVPNGEQVTQTAQVAHVPVKAHEKPKAHKPARTRKAHGRGEERISIGPDQYDRLVVPETEDDPHWDPKLRNPVPEGVVESLADFGWDESMAAIAVREGKTLKIVHGKTRRRALEKANKLRKAAGLEPITVPVLVVSEDADDLESVVRNMERNTTLNYGVQEIDPMTTAESIFRMLSAGVDERTAAKRHSMTVNDLHGHLLLMDEAKCPPEVQELVRQGKMPFSAALELARRAESMTKSEIKAAAEQVAKVAAGGVKITSNTIKRAAGESGGGPATQKEKKQFILDLQSGDLGGKYGEYAKWAAIVALEVGLGTRTVESATSALHKIARGNTIRVDFKQYQDGPKEEAKPVKGQGKK